MYFTGNKEKAVRKEQLTQKDLAEKLNVTDKAVSKWERGLNFPGIVLFISMIYASYLLSINGIYGRAQMVTSGMLDFVSLEMGNALYTLLNIGRLKK